MSRAKVKAEIADVDYDLLYQEAEKLTGWLVDEFERMSLAGTPEKRLYLHHEYDGKEKEEVFWYYDKNKKDFHHYYIKYYTVGFCKALLRAIHNSGKISIIPVETFYSITLNEN